MRSGIANWRYGTCDLGMQKWRYTTSIKWRFTHIDQQKKAKVLNINIIHAQNFIFMAFSP